MLAPASTNAGMYFVGIGDHQVNIQRQLCRLVNGFDDRRPDGDIRHKVAIHDVDMQEVDASLLDFANVRAQICEIGRQDRRCNTYAHWLTSRRIVSDFDRRYPACGFC